jgi:hypothetical protein
MNSYISAVNRMQLAIKICNISKAPEQALSAIFNGAISELENLTKREFEYPLKQRIWEVISERRLQELKETLLSEVYLQIQEDMSEEEVAENLNHQKNTVYIVDIQRPISFPEGSAKKAVLNKAKTMVEELIFDLIAELKKEGICFPKK